MFSKTLAQAIRRSGGHSDGPGDFGSVSATGQSAGATPDQPEASDSPTISSDVFGFAFQQELQALVAHARRRTHADGAAIAVSNGVQVICRVSRGLAPEPGVVLDVNKGICGRAFTAGESLVASDPDPDSRREVRSVAVAPILDDGHSIGVVAVFSQRPEAFQIEHLETLERVALVVESLRSNKGVAAQPEPAEPVSNAESSAAPSAPGHSTLQPHHTASGATTAEVSQNGTAKDDLAGTDKATYSVPELPTAWAGDDGWGPKVRENRVDGTAKLADLRRALSRQTPISDFARPAPEEVSLTDGRFDIGQFLREVISPQCTEADVQAQPEPAPAAKLDNRWRFILIILAALMAIILITLAAWYFDKEVLIPFFEKFRPLNS